MPTDKFTIDWYNKNAKNYTKHVRDPDDSIFHSLYEKPAMYKLLPDLKGEKVLSLGCGSGEDSSYLEKKGASRSLGIDIASELIKIAQDSYRDCEFKVMDMENLEFSDNSFDFAYSSLAIHYLRDWSKVFEEVYRILKPGCFFLFSCAHPVSTSMQVIEHSENRLNLQLSMNKNRKAQTVKVHGNYLGRNAQTAALGPNTGVTTWHKSFGEIFAEVKKAGFVLDDFVEPRPLPKMKKLAPATYEQLIKIPEFLIVKLKKSTN